MRENAPRAGKAAAGKGAEASRGLVESVKITVESWVRVPTSRVELTVAVSGDGDVWVPIRLDNQRLVAARENGAGSGRAPAGARGVAGAALGAGRASDRGGGAGSGSATSWRGGGCRCAIPEAASTRLELDLGGRGSDIVIGSNEDFGQNDAGRDKRKPVTAHLSPRSKLDVSWLDDADSAGAVSPPLLTAQGEIAIEMDAQADANAVVVVDPLCSGDGEEPGARWFRTTRRSPSSSLTINRWTRRSARRGGGKADDYRWASRCAPEASARLVLRTRRSLAKSGPRRIFVRRLSVFGCARANGIYRDHEQPEHLGRIDGAEGLHRIDASKLPSDCGPGRRPVWPTSFSISRSCWISPSSVSGADPRGNADTSGSRRGPSAQRDDDRLDVAGRAVRARGGRCTGHGSRLGRAARVGRELACRSGVWRAASADRLEKQERPAERSVEPTGARQQAR